MACVTKLKFNSIEMATKKQKDVLDEKGTFLRIYDCENCDFYHLTKISKTEAKKVKTRSRDNFKKWERNKNVLNKKDSLKMFEKIKARKGKE